MSRGTGAPALPPCSTTTARPPRPLRAGTVAKALRSPFRQRQRDHPPHQLPVHSFQSLLADLARLTRNTVVTPLDNDDEITLYARPAPIQQKALDLLGLKPQRTR